MTNHLNGSGQSQYRADPDAEAPSPTAAVAEAASGAGNRVRSMVRGRRETPAPGSDPKAELMADVRRRHPGFWEAVRADAEITAANRGERHQFTSELDAVREAIRLATVSDAFLGQVYYRAKAAMQAKGIPLLPRIAHRKAMSSAQVCIGDPVVMAPGVYLAHGQVVIDGITEIEAGVTIFPWVTIGLRPPDVQGPTIKARAKIGSGSKVLGAVTIGKFAKVGANAVVLVDIPNNKTAIGIPATVR